MTDRWRSADFVDGAHAWIDTSLAELGIGRTGDIEQPHVEEWSTVMRVPTDDGTVWFKVNHEPLRHEAALTALVSARRPPVPAPMAFDPDSGWMLMRDAGGGCASWSRRSGRSTGGTTSSTPAPDPARVRGRRARAPCARRARSPARHPARVVRRAAGRLDDPGSTAAVAGRVAARCDELAAFGVRETLQHDDLHDGQVFLGSGTHLLLDWGDACVSHPFFTLSVTLEGVVGWGVDDVAGSEVLDPYRELPGPLPRALLR